MFSLVLTLCKSKKSIHTDWKCFVLPSPFADSRRIGDQTQRKSLDQRSVQIICGVVLEPIEQPYQRVAIIPAEERVGDGQ